MQETLVIHGGEVLTPRGWEKSDIVVEHGLVRRLVRKASRGGLTLDAGGARVLPGLIDLHVNGAFGHDFSTATVAECADVARRLAARGTTSFLATLMSLPEKVANAALSRLAEARGLEASILGIHLEGPYLNPERAGAHLLRHIRPPTLVEFTRMAGAGVRMMTLAPEIKGALSLIAAAGKRKVIMAAGHTMASRAEMDAAVREGLHVVTHLFNAMRPFHHREEGITDFALLDGRVTCTIIYDRRHVSRSAAELAWRSKPRGKLILVSDATAVMEAPDGVYEVGGTRHVVKGGKAAPKEEGRLGGSSVTLLQCVRALTEDLGLKLEEAWECASASPATLLGINKGAIVPDADADLVVMDGDWKLRAVVAGGKVVATG